MSKFIGYIYFDKERDWESYFSTDPHWADNDENWYLAGEVSTLQDVHNILNEKFDDEEYVYHFIKHNISHYAYCELEKQSKNKGDTI